MKAFYVVSLVAMMAGLALIGRATAARTALPCYEARDRARPAAQPLAQTMAAPPTQAELVRARAEVTRAFQEMARVQVDMERVAREIEQAQQGLARAKAQGALGQTWPGPEDWG